jgi:hypothetical protein
MLKMLNIIATVLVGKLPPEKAAVAWSKFIEFVEALSPDTIEVKK